MLGWFIGAGVTALIGYFILAGNKDSKEPEVTPTVIKTREQWLEEVKLVKEALLAVTPKYRIYKLRDGTYAPQRAYARSENSEWYVTEYTHHLLCILGYSAYEKSTRYFRRGRSLACALHC